MPARRTARQRHRTLRPFVERADAPHPVVDRPHPPQRKRHVAEPACPDDGHPPPPLSLPPNPSCRCPPPSSPTTRRVADWQLTHREAWDKMPAARPSVREPRDWQQATFWVALTDLATRDARYRDPVIELGRAEKWQLGKLAYHADDQLIAQAWEWAARNGGGTEALAPARAYFDNVFANRRTNSLEFVPTQPGAAIPCAPNAGAGATRCSWRRRRCCASGARPATSAMPNSSTRNGKRRPTICSTRARTSISATAASSTGAMPRGARSSGVAATAG